MLKTQKQIDIKNPTIDNFLDLCENIYDSYDQYKFLNVITLFENFQNSDNYEILYFKYFNSYANIAILASICCFNIGEYKKAKDILHSLDDKYYIFRRCYYLFMQNLRKKDFKKYDKEICKKFVKHINQELKIFNKHTRLRFYNNLAYAYYKNELFKDASEYYKKALPFEPDNIQLIVGYHQAIYYNNPKHRIQGKDIDSLVKDINKIMSIQSDFNTYLALGKLYYFLGKHKKALNYINISINMLTNDEKNKKVIFAYDWISRIAYKQKQYAIAAVFYEKIIDALIKDENKIFINHETIHPKPELYKMLNFLNETRQLIANKETSKLNKSIWSGIILTSIFGIYQIGTEQHFKYYQYLLLCIAIFIIGYFIVKVEFSPLEYLEKLFSKLLQKINCLCKKNNN